MINTKDYAIVTNSLKDKNYLQGIGDLFKLPGSIKKITLLKDGSWATTYKVSYDTQKVYLFQRMKVPKKTLLESTANAEMLLEFLEGKNITPIHFHHTTNRESIVEYDSSFWRVKRYFDSFKLPQLEEHKDFVELGEIIGQFVLTTKDFDVGKLTPIIPKDHLLASLIESNDNVFDDAIKRKSLIIEKNHSDGLIPLRAVHNDYKIKKVTLKESSRFYINLDLSSPGLSLYDFANVAITYCLDSQPDDQNRAKLNIDNYKALLNGYLMYAGTVLTKDEKGLFAVAMLAMAVKTTLRNITKEEKAKWWKSAAEDIYSRLDEIETVSSELVEKIKPRKKIKNVSSIERDYSAKTGNQYKAGEYMSISMPHYIKPKGSKFYRAAKRAFDIICSLIGIILLFPLLLIIGILVVSTSKGPMIYVSKRVGKNGRVFNFYKFRSMYKDAEQRLNELLNQNEVEGGVTFKMKNDPRITPFGKFIRKTSIDELPQLFNVLKGDMSLIGPRAAIPREVELYPEEAFDRLMVPQGLSGEWQANGRSDTTFENMIKMDLDYIQNKSGFWYDVGLIFKTIIVVIKGSGAE